MNDFTRMRISNDATFKLRSLKQRTGLTPNLLCRVGLCFSLENDLQNDLIPLDENGQEFNRQTLLGENDLFFISLIKEKCALMGLDYEKYFMQQFKYHLNNGILVLHGRVKSLTDLTNLIEK
jgi:DNA sulfur modification protein DndE